MLIWEREDLLQTLQGVQLPEAIATLRQERRENLFRPVWKQLHEALKDLPMRGDFPQLPLYLDAAVVQIGNRNLLSESQFENLTRAVHLLVPWRKGPFSLFGIDIDSEWRSDLKWDRIAPALPSLQGKVVADIGCNTGYYMLRALADGPKSIIGFEPSERCFWSFELLQRFVQSTRLQVELLGVEHLEYFRESFDIVLCMGILYHHRNPLELLRAHFHALRPGGMILVESQGIPGTEPCALFPPNRYGKAKNVYFVPTVSCLIAWLERVGLSEVELVSEVRTTVDEQRSTPFAPGQSYSDFLMPGDDSRTVEGHPAPLRISVRAVKK